MTDKQIITTFSDGYCIVLEDNKVSIRENEFTKLCIVVGNRTNELLEFVKNIYLDNKYKEQEREELRKIINEAKNSKLDLNSFFAIEATIGEYQLELDRLKAENDELKKAYARLNSLYNDNCNFTGKLEQTLAEIKEIAEPYYALGSKDSPVTQILQKISEVEVGV